MYECLTGRLPHEAESLVALIGKVLEEVPPTPRQVQPDVPAALSDLVMRAMARDREDRPRTAGELYAGLDRIA